jgi:hypothetical protein
MAPGDALTTAPGLPLQALVPYGLEPMSMAFFRAAGTDRLCSGVTKSTPSAALIRSQNWVHAAGGLASASAVVDRKIADLDDAELQWHVLKIAAGETRSPLDSLVGASV